MSKEKCKVCLKNICLKQKAMYCDICTTRIHLKCTVLSNNDYSTFCASSDPWYCPPCLMNIFPFNYIEDDSDFLFALRELKSDIIFNPNILRDLVFNPFCLNKNLTDSNDLDPDDNFFSSNNNIFEPFSNYVLEDEFIDHHANKSDSFSLIHFNLRSLPKIF